MRPSAQLAKTVDEYIERIEGWRADLASELRELVKEVVPKATERIGWGKSSLNSMGLYASSKHSVIMRAE